MFFDPQSVAVIGASRTPGKLGHSVLQNIIQHGYQGGVYPINPQADEVLGLRCYPSVLTVPDPVELAVILVPGLCVAQVLAECGEKGVKGAVVISSDFREGGGEGRLREREIVDIARRYGMRLIGPNCLGIIDTVANLNASFAMGMPRRGGIAFISQSGALCTSVLDMALADDVGFSRFVSLGNKADADENDFIEAWRDDPHTRVIMAYLEGIEDGVEFVRIAAETSRQKPIIVIKAGTTDAGSRAVSLHTGTLPGSERAYEAAFRQSGVIRARSVQEMFDYAVAFARQPLLANDRIAIVTNAGGPGIMAADACERAGLQLASLEMETMDALRASLPAATSVLNPVDVLGDAPAERYDLALQAVAADANVGGILVILTPQAMTQVVETAQVVGRVSQETDKPVLGCFMGRGAVEPGIQVLNRYTVPNYPAPERAVAALAAMRAQRLWHQRPPVDLERLDVDRGRVRQVLDGARAEDRLAMGEAEAWQILEAYSIPTPKTCLARTPDEAVGVAEEIGFPVAVKIASPEILHRTDVGGVMLDVADAGQVREAFELMVYRAGRYMPEAEIWGCLVQRMAPDGKAIVIDMSRDARLGPLMTLRPEGVCSEVLKDEVFWLAPLGRREAGEMIRELRTFELLRGMGDEPRSDLEAVVEALLRLSQLAVDFPEISEFNINPVTVLEAGRGLFGIDMRLVLG